MDNISSEIKFLCRNEIKTTKELFLYKKLVTDELKTKVKNRNSLRRKLERVKDTEKKQKICDEILDLSGKIKFLNEEVVFCQNIEERTQQMKSNIKEIEEKENKKERRKNKDELIRFS